MIASISRSCDSKIAALDQEACLLQELFLAMREELMSGRLPAGGAGGGHGLRGMTIFDIKDNG